MNNDIVVSVRLITYNHRDYIKKCLDGILGQKTNFKIEVIIGDDGSDDGTTDIIRGYAKEYSCITHIIQDRDSSERNKYKYVQMFNWYETFKSCSGKYVAFLDGDDYWTDPYKLQKQVDFLEENSNYSMCSHEAYLYKWNTKKDLRGFISILLQNFRLDGFYSALKLIKIFLLNNSEFWSKRRPFGFNKRVYHAGFEDTISTIFDAKYIPTLGIMARNSLLQRIPKELFYNSAGHQIVILWSALFGKIYHSKEIMGVKNTQPTSVTVIAKKRSRSDHIEEMIKVYEIIENYAYDNEKRILRSKIEELKIKKVNEKN